MENSRSTEALGWVRVGITVGAAYLGYRFVLKPLLEATGLKESSEDKVVNDVESLPPNKNPFDPTYKTSWPANAKTHFIIPPTQKAKYIKILWDATGLFNDDEEAIYGVFRDIEYKTMVSDLAEAFFKEKKKDLYGYLKNYLNSTELATVLNIVNKKPAGFRLQSGKII